MEQVKNVFRNELLTQDQSGVDISDTYGIFPE